jgi:hypothetical protein
VAYHLSNKSVNIIYISVCGKSSVPSLRTFRVTRNTGVPAHPSHIGLSNWKSSWSLNRRSLVRNFTLALAFAALWTLSGCKKTGEGQYEVQKPVVGTETDTVNTPSVETGTVKDTITVPTVGTEKKEVTLPKVEVKKPKE